ncbi:N-carbamoyl-L-amino-acid hydrolase [Evansella caseinilytica]|uniref:N-carbamoyl-L-amino-acid hydrolase n=1 Tax=Evansella caseinilytica TaxID=1503961 RepID=A0A1H3H0D0_9BACI|nr:M20 family metallo-hydrolase [Evansella caseinilytica]SDY08931.1 N-carbamoyl-L-amino-acid hydrolase [Evansella caseinilytica]
MLKKWLETGLKRLNVTNSMDRPEGFTRLSYSEEEWKARSEFILLAKAAGLVTREDQAGNVIARWEEKHHLPDSPAVAVGSHVDTVVNGGGYDGVAGVLCGLGAVRKLKKEGFRPKYPIEIISFASEESARFGVSTIGSKAMAGLIDTKSLAEVKDRNGVTLKEAVESQGLVFDQLALAERSAGELLSFVELHIEQGTRVEQAGADYGAVTAIACPVRLLIHVIGKAGHTGTTPMAERQDALVAAAELVSYIYQQAVEQNRKSSMPLVATASTIEMEPNVMNVIPGTVRLGVDIRSVSDSLKAGMHRAVLQQCKQLERKYRVTINVDVLVNNPSIHLDEGVHEELVKAGDEAGLKSFTLASGAGHDVMNMAAKWPAGLVFIRCKDGLSHHPQEYTSLEDLEIGATLLASYLCKKAGDDESEDSTGDHRTG